MCTGAVKWCAQDRPGVGRRRGCSGAGRSAEHEAIAHKIAFIAATTFALEAVLDLSAQLADEGRNDIRIEAALAKLWSSEMAWLVADELVQIRGGRGYETADSLRPRAASGRCRPSRCCATCGSTGSSRARPRSCTCSSPARPSTPTCTAAGDIIDPDVDLGRKAKAAARAAGFYARWLPQLVAGRGQLPSSYAEFGAPGQAPAVRRAVVAQARPVDVLRHGPLAGRGSSAGRASSARIVDIGAELFAMAAVCVRAQVLRADGDMGASAYELADVFCRQARLRVERLFDALWHNTDAVDERLAARARRPLHLARGGHARPERRHRPWIAGAQTRPAHRTSAVSSR